MSNAAENMLRAMKQELENYFIEGDYSDNPMEDSGGNFDDAYSLGIDHGFSCLAKEMVNDIDNFLKES